MNKNQKLLIILMEEIGELLEVLLDPGVVDDFDEGCDLPAEFYTESADVVALITILDDNFGEFGRDQYDKTPTWADKAGLRKVGIRESLLELHKASSKILRFGRMGVDRRSGAPRSVIWDFWSSQVWDGLHGSVNDAQYRKKLDLFKGPDNRYWRNRKC
jgi:hypothetical protein